MAICPECKSEQTKDTPFCESCGYRMRRAETIREGHQAIDQAMLAEYLQNGGRMAPDDVAPTIKSMPAIGRETMQEAVAMHPRIGDRPRKMASTPIQKPSDPSTLIEGLRQVDPVHDAERRRSSSVGLEEDTGPELVALRPKAAPVERSGLYADPIAPGRGRLVLFGALWFTATAIGMLVVYFIMDHRNGNADSGSASASAPSEKILIEGGPFRRGLSEDVRSFILQSCFRAHDEPDEYCKEDKLLKGEYPEQTVEVASFEIDSKEVTVALYESCVSAGKCPAVDYRECAVWTPQGLQISLRVPRALREPDRPAVCVTRSEAESYCSWSKGTLPTADQWEKAARGTEAALFPWGDVWASDRANWGEADVTRTLVVGKLDGFEWTAPPGSFPQGVSPYGVYDMAGNVSEWVRAQDALHGQARGGSWISNPFDLRVTSRVEVKADARRTDVGFRCAYAVP
jgi:formylglycine-generating enzyme required for sulfatase activity